MAAVVVGLFLGIALGRRFSVFILVPIIAGAVFVIGVAAFAGHTWPLSELLASVEVWLTVQAGFLIGTTAGVIIGRTGQSQTCSDLRTHPLATLN